MNLAELGFGEVFYYMPPPPQSCPPFDKLRAVLCHMGTRSDFVVLRALPLAVSPLYQPVKVAPEASAPLTAAGASRRASARALRAERRAQRSNDYQHLTTLTMDIFSTSFPELSDPAIGKLNNEFRETLQGGRVVYTGGVHALGEEKVSAVLEKVRTFDDFTESNDPWGEHDFGAFDFEGQRFFWKIDYYDTKFEYRSPDPADPSKTFRVLTVMLADEY